ncbi:MAG TPA: Gfo/Idh/MocA family oxidoreductase [Chloroflexota bacterium]|nr:Gfo/Idh/MocA family oxidoreductase [Chloroflexota bacterium]
MADRIGVGVCGARIARNHIEGYLKIDGVDVLCVAGPDVDRCQALADAYGVPRVVADYREMLAMPDIQAVSICVPNKFHANLAIDALNAGKHVLCEKPLAVNGAEAQRIVDAAHANDRLLMVAFNNRFSANTIALKRIVDTGALGPIHYAKAAWLRREGIPGFGGWFTTKEVAGGGALIDIGVHVLDLALYFMGYPEPATVLGSTYQAFGSRGKGVNAGWAATDLELTNTFDVDDLAIGMIKFVSGATLLIEASWAGYQELNEDIAVHLFGRDGGARILAPEYRKADSVRVFTEIGGQAVNVQPGFSMDDEYVREIRHFVDSIRQGTPSLAPGEQGVILMRIIDALYASAASGREVRLDG